MRRDLRIKNYIGKKNVENLRQKFEDFLESESGFILIKNGDKNRLTDLYKGMCINCVMSDIIPVVEDADEKGLLDKSDEHLTN